ncbi:hybrid sensor histidine kinase/response regulator [Acanthopleuribacter pedis]|uniref:histidine kinase n=1 Tax=Acanthopleuribacter pedis TaxID=442870 RepID=A0A8J7QL05_9BACT|nr:hybrid sensor histidine kinase/response regulator [Acanthopleuribacter pedis]MBO1321845.1 hybrid sensor histidine kinase/response regulator [Acanthopleuribacter pedis]
MSDNERQKILLVDDTPANLKILGQCLRDRYEVSVATSGAQALHMIWDRQTPDLILLDIVMPEMDGYEVCRRLKENPLSRDIPIIFVTALSEAGEETKGLELGAVDYVTKPFSPSIIRARVKNHLDYKRAQGELQRQNHMLQAYARMREDMERISRHDLRTPLNVVINLPQMLLEDDELELDEETRGCLDTILRAGYRMLSMIDMSLDLVKMEQGTYDLKPIAVDLVGVVRKVVADLRTHAAANEVQLVTHWPGAPLAELFITGEELLCYSMTANLVKNAIEASPRGSAVTLSFLPDPTHCLSIHNLGVIPAAARPVFFEKYSTYGKEGGTGLGTYSARLIARTMKGDMGFETSDEKGTEIVIRLPRFVPAAGLVP